MIYRPLRANDPGNLGIPVSQVIPLHSPCLDQENFPPFHLDDVVAASAASSASAAFAAAVHKGEGKEGKGKGKENESPQQSNLAPP